MEPISLILTALAAGAAAGTSATVSSVITDAYAALKTLVRNRLARRPDGIEALERFEQDPKGGALALREELVASRADTDAPLLESAAHLVEMTASSGTTFNVQFNAEVQGAVTGNHNKVDLRFGSESGGSS